jgi:hypothetical protein
MKGVKRERSERDAMEEEKNRVERDRNNVSQSHMVSRRLD